MNTKATLLFVSLILAIVSLILVISTGDHKRTSELDATKLELSIVKMENTLLLENLPSDEWSKGYDEGYATAENHGNSKLRILP